MVVNGKKTRFLLLATVALAIAAVMALAGCSSGPAAKAQSADNKVTVTLNGAKDVSAFGQLEVKTGQGLKVTVAMTGGNADITVKDGSSSVYSTVPDDDADEAATDDATATEEGTDAEKQPVSGNKEFGIELSTDGDMTIMVTGHEDARGTITFEVVSSDEVAELNSDGFDENGESDVEGEDAADENANIDDESENSNENNENAADDTTANDAADNENTTDSDTSTTGTDTENTNENTTNTE